MKAYQPVVGGILRARGARSVLDLPSGSGWLRSEVGDPDVAIDGIDLYEKRPERYRSFLHHDLEKGVPGSLPRYDAIVSCEGIEHIANPGLFLTTAREHLEAGGTLIVTTPNTWYPEARLRYFLRGFFPSFPPLAGKIAPGTHMHVMPWSWPQLYLHLALAGFSEIELHPCLEDRRTRFFERVLALPMRAYCRSRERNAASDEERRFWTVAATAGALYGRRLVVSARKRLASRVGSVS
jgi:SAM-dependent methyltransferase